MELDNLREIWKEMGAGAATQESDADILAILGKKSQSPLSKMKRNLRVELMAIVILYSLTITYYFTAWQGRYREIGFLLLVVAILFVVYYYKKNRLLKQMQSVAFQVRPHLERQLHTLERYVRFYFVIGTLLTPLAYFAAGFIIFFKTPYGGTIHAYVSFVILGILSAVLSYFLNVWYINKLYGRHIKKLKDLLAQMEELEEHRKLYL